MIKKRFILVVLIIIGVWYFWGRDWMEKRSQMAQAPVGEEAEEGTSPQPSPNLGEGENRAEVGEGKARVHYFTKEALASCSAETVAQELAVDPKYGHRAAGALVVMTLSLPAEASEKYGSALAPGTRLLTMRIDEEGVAYADYNSALNTEAAECVKTQRRAQIESTLKEFPEIKGIVITVEGKVWE